MDRRAMDRLLLANGRVSGPHTCGFLRHGIFAASRAELDGQDADRLWNEAKAKLPRELVHADEFDMKALPHLVMYCGFMPYIDQARLQVMVTLLESQGQVPAAQQVKDYHDKFTARVKEDILFSMEVFRSEPAALSWQPVASGSCLVVDVLRLVEKHRELFDYSDALRYVDAIVSSDTFKQRMRRLSDLQRKRHAEMPYHVGYNMDLSVLTIFLECAGLRASMRERFIALGSYSESVRAIKEMVTSEASARKKRRTAPATNQDA